MPATSIPTKISCFGILLMMRTLIHSNVPIDTMIISPVSAAIGIFSIRLLPYIIKNKSMTEAIIPDNLALAPFEILMRL